MLKIKMFVWLTVNNTLKFKQSAISLQTEAIDKILVSKNYKVWMKERQTSYHEKVLYLLT